jgi:hypothetical protein
MSAKAARVLNEKENKIIEAYTENSSISFTNYLHSRRLVPLAIINYIHFQGTFDRLKGISVKVASKYPIIPATADLSGLEHVDDVYFFSKQFELRSALLQSIILNNGEPVDNVYSAYNEYGHIFIDHYRKCEGAKGKQISECIRRNTRELIPVGDMMPEYSFISTVPSIDAFGGVSNFFGKKKPDGEICCVKKYTTEPSQDIYVHTVPGLHVPSEVSIYPDQREIILPYDILVKYRGQSSVRGRILQRSDGQRQHMPHEATRLGHRTKYKNVHDLEDRLKSFSIEERSYEIVSRVIDRHVMDYINDILMRYYNTGKAPAHNWQHIASVIFLTCILYAELCEIHNISGYNSLIIAICASLFHDSGREKDGPDMWEKDSAKNAEKELHAFFQDTETPIKVASFIHPTRDFTKLELPEMLAFLAYKGADSIDISRVMVYKEELNPVKETHETCSVIGKDAVELYGELIHTIFNKDQLSSTDREILVLPNDTLLIRGGLPPIDNNEYLFKIDKSLKPVSDNRAEHGEFAAFMHEQFPEFLAAGMLFDWFIMSINPLMIYHPLYYRYARRFIWPYRIPDTVQLAILKYL